MPDLDYGYEITIKTPATCEPAPTTVTNQWQRKISGNTNWENIDGANGISYVVTTADRSAKIRLQLNMSGAKANSNELTVTSVELDKDAGLTQFGNIAGDAKWFGGVLGPNGLIYGIPYAASQVLEIDPYFRTATPFGSALNGVWAGGTLLQSNGKIFCAPFTGTDILEINPNNKTTKTFGITGPSITTRNNWMGAVASTNPTILGEIYCIPYNYTKVLQINGKKSTAEVFGNLPSGDGKWSGAVVAPDGKIYAVPLNYSKVLEIDPSKVSSSIYYPTLSTFGNAGTGNWKWSGGVLAPNGKIYCIPFSSRTVLEIDTTGKDSQGFPTLSTFGDLGSNTYKWSGGFLAPNGKIYGIPFNTSKVLEIDPDAKTARTFGQLSGYDKWRGGVLAVEGTAYGVPYNSPKVLEMDFGSPAATGAYGLENWPLSGLPHNILEPRSLYFNKF